MDGIGSKNSENGNMISPSSFRYKYNMTDVSASFALWQWKYLKSWHLIRKKL